MTSNISDLVKVKPLIEKLPIKWEVAGQNNGKPMSVSGAAKVLLNSDENGRRTEVYDACANRVKVYKFDAVLRALAAQGDE